MPAPRPTAIIAQDEARAEGEGEEAHRGISHWERRRAERGQETANGPRTPSRRAGIPSDVPT